MLLTECTYDFIFNSYFINTIKTEYSLLLTALNYCFALLGTAIGTFFCGLVFDLETKYLVLPTLVLAVIHYILASILVEKKKEFLKK
jgi:4-hydroxybenzoate polyprenyltransferase